MLTRTLAGLLATLAISMMSIHASAQDADAAKRIAAQREAMAELKKIDGVWRGPAWVIQANGEKREFVQAERIGPFLDGSVKVMEGRGYGPDGKVQFNAFGIVSYSPNSKSYSLRSYAMGYSGDFAFTPLPDGYVWTMPAGPNAAIRYKATIAGDTFTEVGDRTVEGKEPVRIFEMHLKRVSDSDWPSAGAIPPR